MILPPIQTQRLWLRGFKSEDWRAVYAYAANPKVMHFMPQGPMTPEMTKKFITQHTGEAAEAFPLFIKNKDQLVGHMVYHPWFGPRTYEIGWVIHPAYQGNGYATEAALVLLKHSFETLDAHRVVATCQPENPASYRVMEKIGMRREGHFKKCLLQADGDWWDEYFYAILAEEWFAKGV